MKKDNAELTIIGALALVAVIIILEPLLVFWLGYFSGWLTKITVGTQVCLALNTTFGTSFTPDILPWIGGALGWVGSFFHSAYASKNKSN